VADRFGRPTPGFWDYQAKGLATINQRVDMSTVARHVLGAAVESAFRVTDLMRALKQILRSNKPASK